MAKKTFDEVVLFARTGLNPRNNFKLGNGDNKYITIKNIHDGELVIDDNTDVVSDEAINLIHKRSQIKKGDILFCSIGRIGDMYIIENEPEGWDINESVFAFTLNSDIIYQKYFYYIFKNQNTIRLISKNSSGSTFKSIKMNQIKKMVFELPPLEEQKKVINILDNLSLIIKNFEKELKKLDELTKARFVEMFGDPINNDKEWKTASVESLCTEIYGGGTPSKAHPEYYKDGDIPWVSSKDMKCEVIKDSQIKINQLGVENSTARMVPVNSVIIVIRSGILKHTLPVAINAVPITINQDLKAFIPNELVLAKFLSVQFKMHEKDILSGVRAVTADNIEFNSLKQREMIVPPIELQQQYDVFLSQVDKSRFVVQKALDEAQLLFDSLMQEYFG